MMPCTLEARRLLLETPTEFLAAVIALLELREVYSLIFTLDKALYRRLMTQSIRSIIIPADLPVGSPKLPPIVPKLHLRSLEVTMMFDMANSRRSCLEWINTLPSTLQNLKAFMVPYSTYGFDLVYFERTEEFAFSWPDQLHTLFLGGYLPALAFGAVSLPSSLGRLDISSNVSFPVRLVSEGGDWLPRHLVHLQLPSVTREKDDQSPLLTAIQLAAYPRSLTHLSIGQSSFSEDWLKSPDLCASLPPYLAHMHVSIHDVDISQLPRTLTALNAGNLVWTPQRFRLLPPSIVQLNVTILENTTAEDALAICGAIPRELLSLQLGITKKQGQASFDVITAECLQALPRGLQSLLCNMPLFKDCTSDLPTSITSLTLLSQTSPGPWPALGLSDYCTKFPPFLEILIVPFLPRSNCNSFEKLLTRFPKSLRTLVLATDCEDEMFALLPENLTSLGASMFTGITEAVFQYLPPKLTSLSLPRSFTVQDETTWVQNVPSSLKTINCGAWGTQYLKHRQKALQSFIVPHKIK